MASITQTNKSTIFALPVSPRAPIYHLTPDPLFPNTASFFALSSYEPPSNLGDTPVALKEGDPAPPSMMRRSRMVRGGGTFSYTSPLPLEFPYDIQELGDEQEKSVGREVQARPVTIESKLAEFEPSVQHPVVDAGAAEGGASTRPTAFTSPLRTSSVFPPPVLLSFSRRCAQEWFPQLDVGDAMTLNGSPREIAVREQLVDVLAGRTVLAREANPAGETEVEKSGFAPWSLCYGGHQFGQWAGQLGDGRAISLFSTPTAPKVQKVTGFPTLEIQLKGAGRTPYSRFADGLAVLRSSVREYLGAEAMHALGLPTSRALALVGIPSVKVRRERIETAAIVTRVASSWIRIGNFEIQSNRREWESLRLLSSYVGKQVFGFDDATCPPTDKGRGMALSVVRETNRRTAIMLAGWQAYGFCHGVMNTDNFAVTGACIDYGPYAFMDLFDPQHICNHSDEEGRYSFRNQPTMGNFAVQKLGTALAPVIGCEEELAQVLGDQSGFVEASKGWAERDETTDEWRTVGEEGSSEARKELVTSVEAVERKEDVERWRQVGLAKVAELKLEFSEVFTNEYARLMRLRLGFLSSQPGDLDLVSDLLDLMALHKLDFSSTFRLLSQFPGTSDPAPLARFLSLLLPAKQASVDFQSTVRESWVTWLTKYEARLALPSEVEVAQGASSRRERQNLVNPRFVLRQWILEEVIAGLNDGEGETKALNRVLELASEPFESYGEEEVQGAAPSEDVEETERRRLCGMGSESFLGFQCSCSS